MGNKSSRKVEMPSSVSSKEIVVAIRNLKDADPTEEELVDYILLVRNLLKEDRAIMDDVTLTLCNCLIRDMKEQLKNVKSRKQLNSLVSMWCVDLTSVNVAAPGEPDVQDS
jgi:hypothetical protein